MAAYNFNVPPGMLVATAEDAVRFANQTGYPVAMKISSPDILHKSDVGGVKVGLASASAVEDAFELMMLRIKKRKPDAEIRGVLVEKMMRRQGGDPGDEKGPAVRPGTYVRSWRNICGSTQRRFLRAGSITAEECFKMISSTKSTNFSQVQGEKPVDVPSIVINLSAFLNW